MCSIDILNNEELFVEYIYNNTERKNDPYEDIVNMRKKSYEIYKNIHLKILQQKLEKIGIIDDEIKCLKTINLIDSYKQMSKCRSGRNLEFFIIKIFEQYNIKFNYQSMDNIKGDFIFVKDNKNIILSVKTTLKERWKEFIDDLHVDVNEVYILTLEIINKN